MEWLLEYIDIVLPVVLVLLFLFQRMFTPDEGEGGPPGPGGTDLENEARRIQEEIRRKIIARQQGKTASTEFEETEVSEEPAPVRPHTSTFPRRREQVRPVEVEHIEAPPESMTRYAPQPAGAEATASQPDLLAELRRQKERLEEARKAKEAARASGRQRMKRGARAAPSAAHGLRGQLLADLAGGSSMKRAFLLKEVVDRPIGIRSRADSFSNWS